MKALITISLFNTIASFYIMELQQLTSKLQLLIIINVIYNLLIFVYASRKLINNINKK